MRPGLCHVSMLKLALHGNLSLGEALFQAYAATLGRMLPVLGSMINISTMGIISGQFP